jgi:hypothetical protein
MKLFLFFSLFFFSFSSQMDSQKGAAT